MALTKEELDLRFEPPACTDGGPQALSEVLGDHFKFIAELLDNSISDSRELSIAQTKLEDAWLWVCVAARNMPMDWEVKREKTPRISDEDREKLNKVATALDVFWCQMRDESKLEYASRLYDMRMTILDIVKRN